MKTLFIGLLLGSVSHGCSYVTTTSALPFGIRSRVHSQPHHRMTIPTASRTSLMSSSSSNHQQQSDYWTTIRGGANASASPSTSKCPVTNLATALSSLWGVGGVVYILAKAIVRVLPIAMEPFQQSGGASLAGIATNLSKVQLGAYILTCLWFAYVEGYKGFQTKFSPLVVKRAFTLRVGQSHPLHLLLAPLYSMGLFHATRKRTIVSWSVTIGVAAVVAIVKRLPYPYRNIIDAGVVAGLTWGAISMVVWYGRAWITGVPPPIDPALPKSVQE